MYVIRNACCFTESACFTQQPSNSLVSWRHYDNVNTIYDRFSAPRTESRPSTFYFPNINTRDECVAACQLEAGCYSYTYHPEDFDSLYAGQCYGVSQYRVNHVAQENVYSGKKRSCAICWDRRDNTNAVHGRISGGPGSSDPPNYYYFSQASDRQACQVACENEPDCHAYTFVSPQHTGDDWAGVCYGIKESLARNITGTLIDSGYKVPCSDG